MQVLTNFLEQRKHATTATSSQGSKRNSSNARNAPSSARSPPSSSHTQTTDGGGHDGGAEESEATADEDDRKKRARLLRKRNTTHPNLGVGHPSVLEKPKRSKSMNSTVEMTSTSHAGPSTTTRKTRFASGLDPLAAAADNRYV